MADSRHSGRYLAPALVVCAAAADRGLPRGRTHDRPAVRRAGAVRSLDHRPADIPRRHAGHLPARQARRQGPARSCGNTIFTTRRARILVDSRVLAPAGRQALGRGNRPPRAPAHRGALRHPGIFLRAFRAGAARFRSNGRLYTTISPSRPPTRSTADHGRPAASSTDAAHLAARRLRGLHPRPESACLRSRCPRRQGADPGWGRRDQERHGGVRRAGGDGSQHRILVVARRAPYRLRTRRRKLR